MAGDEPNVDGDQLGGGLLEQYWADLRSGNLPQGIRAPTAMEMAHWDGHRKGRGKEGREAPQI